MRKCDFCKNYNPLNHTCTGYVGGYSCEQALERFIEFNSKRGGHSHKKTVNVTNNFNRNHNGRH
ncbi:MAG: hypothetical protein J6Q69_02325 [Clostridia bacterium]|nr:hypothetical protein [Clostridia bacterium]